LADNNYVMSREMHNNTYVVRVVTGDVQGATENTVYEALISRRVTNQ